MKYSIPPLMKALAQRNIRFDINRIDHAAIEVENLSPDNMLQFLEHMASKSHGPDCHCQRYLIRKIENNKCGNDLFANKAMSNFYLSDLVLTELNYKMMTLEFIHTAANNLM